jgi:hypothetical protein
MFEPYIVMDSVLEHRTTSGISRVITVYKSRGKARDMNTCVLPSNVGPHRI